MHYLTNQLIELDGAHARIHFFQHNRGLAGGGVYSMDAVRTDQGWRVDPIQSKM